MDFVIVDFGTPTDHNVKNVARLYGDGCLPRAQKLVEEITAWPEGCRWEMISDRSIPDQAGKMVVWRWMLPTGDYTKYRVSWGVSENLPNAVDLANDIYFDEHGMPIKDEDVLSALRKAQSAPPVDFRLDEIPEAGGGFSWTGPIRFSTKEKSLYKGESKFDSFLYENPVPSSKRIASLTDAAPSTIDPEFARRYKLGKEDEGTE
jgi:hypothetical protein